jgi:ubiquinone/menaquinone biosynthesis C-methylase UbiE
MTQKNRTPRRSSVIVADIGRGTGQVAAHPHDSGSQANETVDGLDATTESLRHATEDMPATGTGPSDIEKTPVFDRAGEAPRIWAGSRL